MRLNKIDFLSNTPKNFIFKKSSNKTFFGGILSIIYIIIVILLSSYYFILYETENSYYVQYFHYDALSTFKETIKDFNPYFNFKFLIATKKNGKYHLDNFKQIVLVNMTNYQTIPKNTSLNLRSTDLKIMILYNLDEYGKYDKDDYSDLYLVIVFNGFAIDHKKTPPLYQVDENDENNLIFTAVQINLKID